MTISTGQITGVLSGLATILTAFGLTQYAGILVSPTTATVATAIVGTLGSLIAGHLPGGKKAA